MGHRRHNRRIITLVMTKMSRINDFKIFQIIKEI